MVAAAASAEDLAEVSVVDLVVASEAAPAAEVEVYSPTRGSKLPRPCTRFLSEPLLIPTKKEAEVATEAVVTPQSLALTFTTMAAAAVVEVAAMVEDSEAATVVDSEEEAASVVEDMEVAAEVMAAPLTPLFR